MRQKRCSSASLSGSSSASSPPSRSPSGEHPALLQKLPGYLLQQVALEGTDNHLQQIPHQKLAIPQQCLVQSKHTRKRSVCVSPERTSGKMRKPKSPEKRQLPSLAPKPRKLELCKLEKEKVAKCKQQIRYLREANTAKKTSSLYLTLASLPNSLRILRSV